MVPMLMIIKITRKKNSLSNDGITTRSMLVFLSPIIYKPVSKVFPKQQLYGMHELSLLCLLRIVLAPKKIASATVTAKNA